MVRLALAGVVTGCLVQPVQTRVPEHRIGPLAEGIHEVRGSVALLRYEVRGVGPVCLARTDAQWRSEQTHTVVYFNTTKRRYLEDLRRQIGLAELPRCRR